MISNDTAMEVRGVLLPLQSGQLLLPNISVSEVVGYGEPEEVPKGAPDWLHGVMSWRHYQVPLYVCMPTSTLDRRCPEGAAIPIEERDGAQVRGFGGVRWAADVEVYDPAFDVTPAALIAGWVTEQGVWRPPFPDTT